PSVTTANTESGANTGGSLSGVVRLDVEYCDALHSFFYHESATGGAAAPEEQTGTTCSTCGHDTSLAYYQHPVSATRVCVRCYSLGLYSGAEQQHYQVIEDDDSTSSVDPGSGAADIRDESSLEFVEVCDKYHLCACGYGEATVCGYIG
ncbi:hypothetical protein FOZ62_017625, partial [Perkinsus olseni]